jgi:hypothetical protein
VSPADITEAPAGQPLQRQYSAAGGPPNQSKAGFEMPEHPLTASRAPVYSFTMCEPMWNSFILCGLRLVQKGLT